MDRQETSAARAGGYLHAELFYTKKPAAQKGFANYRLNRYSYEGAGHYESDCEEFQVREQILIAYLRLHI